MSQAIRSDSNGTVTRGRISVAFQGGARLRRCTVTLSHKKASILKRGYIENSNEFAFFQGGVVSESSNGQIGASS